MGFLPKVRELLKTFIEENEMTNIEEMDDKQREDILKSYEEGYKEFCKSDSAVKPLEESVKDYTNLISKMEAEKVKTVDIRNVMTANTRAAMMKYHPEVKKHADKNIKDNNEHEI